MNNEDLLRRANEIVAPYGLQAELLPDIFSVGVQGDNRSYLPVIVLKGPFPGWDVIQKVSTEIPNTLPVNRVTYDITPGSGFKSTA